MCESTKRFHFSSLAFWYNYRNHSNLSKQTRPGSVFSTDLSKTLILNNISTFSLSFIQWPNCPKSAQLLISKRRFLLYPIDYLLLLFSQIYWILIIHIILKENLNLKSEDTKQTDRNEQWVYTDFRIWWQWNRGQQPWNFKITHSTAPLLAISKLCVPIWVPLPEHQHCETVQNRKLYHTGSLC